MERWVRSKIASTSSSWACSLATASASTWARADIGKEQITFCPLQCIEMLAHLKKVSGNKSTHYVWGFWRPLDLFNPDQDGSNLIWKAPRVCENPCRCFSFDLTNAIKTEISQLATLQNAIKMLSKPKYHKLHLAKKPSTAPPKLAGSLLHLLLLPAMFYLYISVWLQM